MTFANGRTVGGYEEAFTVNYVAVQPGAGVTLMITPRLGIRLQTDLQVAIPIRTNTMGSRCSRAPSSGQ